MIQRKNTAEKIIFAIVYIFCCMLMSSNKLPIFWSASDTYFMYYKVVFCFATTFTVTTALDIDYRFISKFTLFFNIIVTGLFTFDYYVTQISGSQFLFKVWWIIAIMMSALGVFIGETIKHKSIDYPLFFKRFMISIAPLYMVTFFICFMRKPADNISINTQLFGGTFSLIPYIIESAGRDFEPPLIFIGNIFIFTPVPVIIKGIWNKIKPVYLVLIGFMLPLFAEGYQYVFKCGNVDIDDIVMNWAGYGIGLVITYIISKKLLNKGNANEISY